MRVIVHRCDEAPASDRWDATENGYDLGIPIGHGDTPLAAIEDLLWAMNIEDIEPEDCTIDWC
jgi:hypothetical protein